jgi:ATP-grasp domain
MFPIHAELKLMKGELFPIEFNPMRFGGLGLGDLSYYAFGINPYKYYFE